MPFYVLARRGAATPEDPDVRRSLIGTLSKYGAVHITGFNKSEDGMRYSMTGSCRNMSNITRLNSDLAQLGFYMEGPFSTALIALGFFETGRMPS